jgi:hypothetical protein
MILSTLSRTRERVLPPEEQRRQVHPAPPLRAGSRRASTAAGAHDTEPRTGHRERRHPAHNGRSEQPTRSAPAQPTGRAALTRVRGSGGRGRPPRTSGARYYREQYRLRKASGINVCGGGWHWQVHGDGRGKRERLADEAGWALLPESCVVGPRGRGDREPTAGSAFPAICCGPTLLYR